MDLWIRSRTGEMLLKAKGLIITNHNGNRYFIECNEHAVAVYDTEERAIEVLDEIHQRLIDMQTIGIMPDAYVTLKKVKRDMDCVYQMPKE